MSGLLKTQDRFDLYLFGLEESAPSALRLLEAAPKRGNATSARLELFVERSSSGIGTDGALITARTTDPLVGAGRDTEIFRLEIDRDRCS